MFITTLNMNYKIYGWLILRFLIPLFFIITSILDAELKFVKFKFALC